MIDWKNRITSATGGKKIAITINIKARKAQPVNDPHKGEEGSIFSTVSAAPPNSRPSRRLFVYKGMSYLAVGSPVSFSIFAHKFSARSAKAACGFVTEHCIPSV